MTAAPCGSCHRPNRADRRYCGGCGANLSPICRGCGFANEGDDRFCGGCGVMMNGSAAVTHGSAAVINGSAAGMHGAAAGLNGGAAGMHSSATVMNGDAVTNAAPSPTTRAKPNATVFEAIDMAELFRVDDEPPPSALPEDNITQADLDKLFGAAS